MSTATQSLTVSRPGDPGKGTLLRSMLQKDAALSGLAWLPLALVLGAVSAVAYADHLVVSISLVYLYILPLAVGAIFLRTKASYGLIRYLCFVP